MAGIVAGHNFKEAAFLFYIFFGISVGTYLLLKIFKVYKSGSPGLMLGFLFFLSIFCFGASLINQYAINNKPDKQLYESPSYYLALVKDDSEARGKNYRTEVEVILLQREGQWEKASGKILTYHSSTSGNAPFNLGDLIMIKGPPNVVPAPANPEEFDYRQYLQNQQIYFQHFLKPDDYILVAGETVKGISYYIKTLRKNG
ncbi:MAG: DUF4131 domain-containing protein, partial [Bacteroidota bacterium]|nr:DUF4131 domain-containing protein [Bacteroidota bacterium]